MSMYSHAIRLSTIVLTACAVTGAYGQGKWVHAPFVTSQVEGYRKHFDVPGLSVAVAKDGKIIYSQGFGWANVKKKVKVEENTRFRLASVSKPVTAIMFMELEEAGKIHRNHKVRDHLPKLPKHHTYRLWHLLSHQSGVRHYDGKNFTTNTNYESAEKAMDRFKNDKLRFIPGQEYHYSTHGFTVLGAAMEKVTKQRFGPYVSIRAMDWGVTALRAETNAEGDIISKTYKREDRKNKETHRDNLSWKYPGGGMVCTAKALCQLGVNLAAGKILNKTSLDTMWKGRDAAIEDSSYGLGWGVGKFKNHRAVSHSGSQNGANSYWRILPDKGVVVVVLSNRDAHDPKKLANFLTGAALKEDAGPLGKMIYD